MVIYFYACELIAPKIAVIITFVVVSKFKQKAYSANKKKKRHATPCHVISRKITLTFSTFYLPTYV